LAHWVYSKVYSEPIEQADEIFRRVSLEVVEQALAVRPAVTACRCVRARVAGACRCLKLPGLDGSGTGRPTGLRY
jgi:hypothetical protein